MDTRIKREPDMRVRGEKRGTMRDKDKAEPRRIVASNVIERRGKEERGERERERCIRGTDELKSHVRDVAAPWFADWNTVAGFFRCGEKTRTSYLVDVPATCSRER